MDFLLIIKGKFYKNKSIINAERNADLADKTDITDKTGFLPIIKGKFYKK